MSVEIRVPHLAESISDAVLVEWLKADGSPVRTDEAVATLETEKAAVEIAAPENGVLRHARQVGDRVTIGELIARVEPAGAGEGAGAPGPAPAAPAAAPSARGGPAAPAPAPPPAPAVAPVPVARPAPAAGPASGEKAFGPAVRRLVEEHRLDAAAIPASGPGGRLLKEDVLRYLERPAAAEGPAPPDRGPAPAAAPEPVTFEVAAEAAAPDERVEPMSRIRQRIAERLVRAQQTAAILTTFNEIDMTAVLELRARYREEFERRHGVRLGFMSFFTRATALALHEIPQLNAEIRGADMVYKRRVHMGVAVGSDRGLVVPVVRDADRLGFAAIEREIARLAERARAGSLTLEELSGGTFSISNGGVYGSLLSTPILNPPQSGILGLHKIERRPIAVEDQVVIRSMMYVALSYDHRIVDGEQAVTFLRRVKERIEDPERMLLEV